MNNDVTINNQKSYVFYIIVREAELYNKCDRGKVPFAITSDRLQYNLPKIKRFCMSGGGG